MLAALPGDSRIGHFDVRAGIDKRVAEVDVIQEHMGRGEGPDIVHAIGNRDR